MFNSCPSIRSSTAELVAKIGMFSQVPLYTRPTSVIPGTAGIVQHAILNDRRHVLTKVLFLIATESSY